MFLSQIQVFQRSLNICSGLCKAKQSSRLLPNWAISIPWQVYTQWNNSWHTVTDKHIWRHFQQNSKDIFLELFRCIKIYSNVRLKWFWLVRKIYCGQLCIIRDIILPVKKTFLIGFADIQLHSTSFKWVSFKCIQQRQNLEQFWVEIGPRRLECVHLYFHGLRNIYLFFMENWYD